MKIALLFTAFRQREELPLMRRFLAVAPTLSQATIVYACNNPAFTAEQIRGWLDTVPGPPIDVRLSTENAGYSYGNFQAVAKLHPELAAGGFDWVIKLHPDVFLLDEKPILAALAQADGAGASVVATRVFGHHEPAFGADLFAFKPAVLPTDFFAGYRRVLGQTPAMGEERLFHEELHRRAIPFFELKRYAGGHYYQDPDLAGFWHEHRIQRVIDYLVSPDRRWRTTRREILRSPVRALRVFRVWLRGKRAGGPRETLIQRLTLV